MAYYYVGVTPKDGSSTSILRGVYLRLGEYVDTFQELGEMPPSYADNMGDASGTEGIFITTCGDFILNAGAEGDIEYQNGVIQVVENNVETTVKDGNAAMSLTAVDGAISITGKNSFEVESETGDLVITAEHARVSVGARHVFSRTAGSHKSFCFANKKRGITGASTNVSLGFLATAYGAPTVTAKIAALSMKILSAYAVLFKFGIGIFSMKFYTGMSKKYTLDDTNFSYFYIKTRGIQLETAAVKNEAAIGMSGRFGTVKFWNAAAKAEKGAIKASLGLSSHIPGG